MPKVNPEEKKTVRPKMLYRSEANRILGGVAGGLGEYFHTDPSVFRLLFVLSTIFFPGSGIIIYLVLWAIIPTKSRLHSSVDIIKENTDEMRERAEQFAQGIRVNSQSSDTAFWWGIIILVTGFLFLFRNFGIFEFFEFSRFWPLILIVLGFILLIRR